MAATLVASSIKSVTDGRFNTSLYPASDGFPITFAHGVGKDLPVGQTGDRMVAVVLHRPSSSQVSMPSGQDWQVLRPAARTTDPPALDPTPGHLFNEATDVFTRKGSSISVFAFVRDYTPSTVWEFAAIRSDTGAGGQLFVLLMLVRGGAENPFVTLNFLFNSTPASVYNAAGLSGLIASAPAIRLLWMALTSAVPETVSFQGGEQWSDVSGVSTSALAFGSRNSNLLVVGHTGTSDGSGAFPAEDVSLSPSTYTTIDAMTFLLAPKEPTNLFSSPPGILGTVQGGKTLTANPGGWVGSGPITYAYQWQAQPSGGSFGDVSGATGSTLNVLESMVGKPLRLKITATGAGGTTIAFSTATSVVVTGLDPAPTGTPAIAGNIVSGLTLPNELLTANLSGVTWTPGASLVTEWGRSTDSSMVGAAIVASGATRTTVTADNGLWLSVRQRDQNTGVTTTWAPAVRCTRSYSSADREYRFSTPNQAGDLIPGVSLIGSAGGFSSLHVSDLAGAGHVDVSIRFIVNTHPDISAAFQAYIVDAPENPAVTIEFAKLAVATSTPVPAFTPPAQPAITGGWHQPTADAPLDLGTVAAQGGYVGLAIRRTVARGAGRYREDKLTWEVDPVVPVVS